jgi:hypothetical protein
MLLTIAQIVVGLVVLLYLAPLVLGVIAIKKMQVIRKPQLAQLDGAWLDEAWRTAAEPMIAQLETLGFERRCFVDGFSLRTEPTGMRCAAVLVHDGLGEEAHVAVAEQPTASAQIELRVTTIFTFRSKEKRVVTSNATMGGIFARPAAYRTQAFPMLRDPAKLHRAHRAIVEEHVGRNVRGEVPAPGTEVASIEREMIQELDYQHDHGRLTRRPDGSYVQTWFGAMNGVWRLHPRFAARHARRQGAEVSPFLAKLGLEPDPMPEAAPSFDTSALQDELTPEMDEFLKAACEEYTAKSEHFRHEMGLDGEGSFHADLSRGIVEFHHSSGAVVSCDVQILGSWRKEDGSFEWAWNNPNVVAELTVDAARARDFGREKGLVYLANGFVPAPQAQFAAYYGAVAGKVVNARAVLSLPPDPVADMIVLVAVKDARRVQPNAA